VGSWASLVHFGVLRGKLLLGLTRVYELKLVGDDDLGEL
jgi:hypothetical protein